MKRKDIQKHKFYVVSISWGKDSTYMLEYLLKQGRQVDMVMFVNTGYEFKAVLDVRNKAVRKLQARGIPYVELDVKEEFEYLMLQHMPQTRDGSLKVGLGWCGGVCRWGTSLKITTLNQFYKRELLDRFDVVEYVGIAADEKERTENAFAKENADRKIYPLVEAGITEAMCLKGCYELGYTWEEDEIRLYELLDRLSCWNCRNKNLKELKAIYYFLPVYWEKLRNLQSKIKEPMKGEGKSVFDLEKRFRKEGWQWNLYYEYDMPDIRR